MLMVSSLAASPAAVSGHYRSRSSRSGDLAFGCSSTITSAAHARFNQALARRIEWIHHGLFESSEAESWLHADDPDPTVAAPQFSASLKTRELPHFFQQLSRLRLLTPAEEVQLFRKMNYLKYRAACAQRELDPARPDLALVHEVEQSLAASEELRNRIWGANLRLVVGLAKSCVAAQLSLDELISEGSLALWRAVEKFDFDRGFRFSTYATHVVRRTLFRLLQQRRHDLSQLSGAVHQRSQDMPEDDDGPLPVTDFDVLQTALNGLLARLNEREQLIVAARFGLREFQQPLTLQALADQLGVCKERVRQLELRAIAKLRTWAEELSPDRSGSGRSSSDRCGSAATLTES